MPVRIEECLGGKAPAEYHESEFSYYKHIYINSIDNITNGIKDRFDQPDYKIYVHLENLLLKAARKQDFSSDFLKVISFYKEDFDKSALQLHLEILGKYTANLDLINLRTILDLLREIPRENRSLINQVYVLAHLILVMPATNATSERSFSLLRIIKSYLRLTMDQERLNHLMLLSTYKSRLDSIDLKHIGKAFVNKNERRKFIFGHF